MTMTRPWRRMIRHLLQIFLTLGLTFTVCLTFLRARGPSGMDGHYAHAPRASRPTNADPASCPERDSNRSRSWRGLDPADRSSQ